MVRRWSAAAAGLLRGRDVGAVYAGVVLISGIVVFAQPHGVAAQAVLDSSTNVSNLRTQPLLVLVLSAFVVSSLESLWILPCVVWVFGAAQRWVGRAATVLVAAFGHVFATVFVGILVHAGIAHHALSNGVAHEPDVGVSYGLAALVGLMVFRLPQATRRKVAVLGTAALIGFVLVSQTFTDLGHLVAWGIGLAMGFVGSRFAETGR
ncbi:MAG: hypothetical protein JWM02_2733 [Frankiales bacterium]|nr:hypothetical protein [Frankiales bacterium]